MENECKKCGFEMNSEAFAIQEGICIKCGKIIKEAKKEVFDDIEYLSRPLAGDFGETPIYKDYQKLKTKHLGGED